MNKNSNNFPHLGFGLGLRPKHYEHIFAHKPKVDWFEIISENFMDTDGRSKRNLAKIRELYPIVMHGVAMSIGTVDPLNSEYLQKLKKLADEINPAWISDHLCWTGIAHKNSHDLLPVPYTEEALKHIISRVKQVQDFLERPIALENPSTYLEFKTSYIPEAEFIAQMAKESGCNLLLDVNNVYVSCFNHRLDPQKYIDVLPLEKVIQIHLSGHSNMGTHIIDTHDDYVVDEVWALYRYATHKAGRVFNTMVEWDDNIPEFPVLFAELEKAKIAAKTAADYSKLPQLAKLSENYIPNIITPLAESQTKMQDAILLGAGIDSQPENWILSKENFAPVEQLNVYVNAYRYRLYDVTAEDFLVLKNYLGDDNFDRLIKDFVNSVQSDHFNIAKYTAHLPKFLARHALADKFALEIAELENAVSVIADFAETLPLKSEHLAGITPEELMEVVLHPRKALQLFEFEYPVNDYYGAVKNEKSPKTPKPKKTFVATFRHDDLVWRMDLEKNEYHLLSKLFAGMTIGESLETLQAELNIPEQKLAANLSEWFSRWIRNGLLAASEYKNEQLKKDVA